MNHMDILAQLNVKRKKTDPSLQLFQNCDKEVID